MKLKQKCYVNRKKKQIRLSIKALEPEIVEFKPAKKEDKKGRGKRAPKNKAADVPAQEEEAKEAELTVMQIAWQEALDKANTDRSFKMKRMKPNTSQEQEDILSRTLEKRLPTGG